MILMYWSGLIYFLSLHNDALLQLITQSMVIIIQWDTILPMAYIQSGQHLWKQSQLHKDKKKKKKKKIAKAQEAYRKDVERAFGVL